MAFRLSGLASGMDTESMVAELMKAQKLKSTKIENKITKSEWTQEKWKGINTKLYSFYTGPLSKLKMQGSFSTMKVAASNESKVSVTANTGAPAGSHTLQIKKLASAQFETGNKLTLDKNSQAITTSTKLTDLNMTAGTGNKITINAGGTPVSLEISETTTVGDFTKALKSAGLNATYDTTQKRFFISSKDSGYANAFSITTEGTVDLSKLGLSTITKTDNGDGTVSVSGGNNLIPPTDAKFVYNGTSLTSSTNTFTANGLTFTLKGITDGADPLSTTDDETINLSVTKDTQAAYDMVKNFVKSYNELITDMNESYYAASSKGFDPLTEEQKESMSEDQIDKWETKIKDSLLRRDNTLDTLLNTMRSTLSETVDVSGKKYSLSSFGIVSGNYTEKGLLHINGDSDESLLSGLSNDLMKALTEDPDKVMKVLNTVSSELYSSMTDKMSSTSMRSALTFYNDKDMAKTLTNYKEDLKTMESKLSDMEDKYYKQFAAMESAMAKMNSQSSSLASMLGTSQG